MIKEQKKGATFWDSIKVLFQAILLALLVRSFIIQPFVIPSGSMRPTLLVGDYLFVSKFSYGYSSVSFPFRLPFFHGRLFGSQPHRGDVVVFHHKDQNDGVYKDFIKRVIGLPGDKIELKNGVVFINDKPVARKRIGKASDSDITGALGDVDLYRETLPNGVSYDTLSIDPAGSGNNRGPFFVPAGHYFMMGDNRDNSEDSRFSLGPIAYNELIGKASFLFFSLKNGSHAYEIWRWPFDLRLSRLFVWIDKVDNNLLHALPQSTSG